MEDFASGAGAEDSRKWISAREAAALLRLGQRYFSTLAKERGYTRRQKYRNKTPFYLRKEIESWADFRQLRRQWIKKYPGFGGEKRYTEKIDLELARRLFIPTKEAAALLDVSLSTVDHMAREGRLITYQGQPGHGGSQRWFSRRAVMQIASDPKRLKKREDYFKGLRDKAGVWRLTTDAARNVREGVPQGWLTTKETAERLGVSRSRVGAMRLTGRLRGERIWRRNRTLQYWYYPDYEVERAISWREQVKELAGLPLLAVPGSPPPPTPAPASGGGESMPAALVADAPPVSASVLPPPPTPTPASGGGESMPFPIANAAFVPKAGSAFRLDADGPEPEWACDDADGPEPKWACDDEELTRAFFRLDRPGD